MNFSSFEAFAEHLLLLEKKQLEELQTGLRKVMRQLKRTAQSEFGTYQPAAGPFPAWVPLAAATKAERIRKGFTPNDPLLRSGELRKSLHYRVKGLEGQMGSTSDVMVAQELGTATIPPRPVLGPAVVRNRKTIEEILGAAAIRGLLPPNHPGAPKGPTETDYDQSF